MPKKGQEKGTPRRRAEFVQKLRGLGEGTWCVPWPWSDAHDGYARIYVDGVKVGAHRWVYEQIYGPLPHEHTPGAIGSVVMHICTQKGASEDHPWCVRPSHLTLGLNKDNLADAAAKGRMKGRTTGMFDPRRKLSDEDVVAVRRLAAEGVQQSKIARSYNVSPALINSIVRGHRRLPRE